MIKSMNVNDLKTKLDNDENVVLIDCREQGEWDEAHIAKANLLPLSVFPGVYEELLKDKDAEIIIQCRSGKRSLNACQFLMEQDFTNLTNLEGGIMAWTAAGFEVKK
jgi:rhodanese-related sulfurtransferase